jgi:long-chain acyl-CoA synthetase
MNEPTRPWLKHYDSEVEASIPIEAIPVYSYLDRAAGLWPDRTAVRFKGKDLSFKELNAAAEHLAGGFADLGISPGTRVSIMLPNLPRTMVVYFALLKAGAVVVMTNPLSMESELQHQLGDAECEAMVLLDHLWPKIGPLRDRLPIKRYIAVTIAEDLPFPLKYLYGFKAKRDKLFQDLPYDGESVLKLKEVARHKGSISGRTQDPRNETALLQYTGGTTGKAKGVVITHANLVANLQQALAVLHEFNVQREIMLSIMPYFHVYGLTVGLNLAVAVGATSLPMPRFDPKETLEIIHKEKPTLFPGAPALYGALLRQKDVQKYDFSSLKYLVSGSAPMPKILLERFKEKTDVEIIEGYGLTEASPVTHLNPLRGKKKLGSIGLPFPDTDCRIVDLETGSKDMPIGEPGELIIRGPQIAQGYYHKPDETADTFRDGWLYTGDVAVMDEDGYFTIVDRKKDMVVVGGYNVYPREIDEVLLTHPKIAEAAALGMSDDLRGEAIKAYIVPAEGEEITPAEVKKFCREQLSSYKVPKTVEIRSELPKTIVGKVLRRKLKEEEEKKEGEEAKTA